VPVQHGEVLVRHGELPHPAPAPRNRRCPEGVLVEVVADLGAVRQQVFDHHVVGDQRQVLAQQGTPVVPSVRVPRSTRITVSAVGPFVPLAVANWVLTELGTPWGRSADP